MSTDGELATLREQGYLILPALLDANEIARITAALAPFEAARPMGRNAFEGRRSQRVYSLAGKDAAFRDLAEHPRVMALLDRWLLPNPLLSTLQSIRLHPGEDAQAWHTDDAFYLIPRPRHQLALSAIWAIEEFTDDNGATQVIPGSHLWAGEHPDERAHEVVTATMPAGSVLIFDGATWHRGGANRGGGTRLCISPQYCQPFLRPQESQLLIAPPDRRCRLLGARAIAARLQHPPAVPRPGRRHAPAAARRRRVPERQPQRAVGGGAGSRGRATAPRQPDDARSRQQRRQRRLTATPREPTAVAASRSLPSGLARSEAALKLLRELTAQLGAERVAVEIEAIEVGEALAVGDQAPRSLVGERAVREIQRAQPRQQA